MARKRRKREEPAGDGWLATYADTITLLLTFFILLYSMSTIDNEKIKQLSQAFQTMMKGQKGTTIMEYDLYNGQVPLIGGESPIDIMIDETDEQADMYYELKQLVEDHKLTEVVDVISTERGILIQLRDSILFEDASSYLSEESKGILYEISKIIADIPNSILVEGHTDNKQINTVKFPSNWELSVERAVNVVRYFTESLGLNPVRFSAAGYGEFQPIVPNDSEDNMSRNRRVNILILASDKG